MFNVTWMPINSNVLAKDPGIGECWLDIVSDATHPALYYYFDASTLYFRMRLDCNPELQGRLRNGAWGILINVPPTGSVLTNTPAYTAIVNTTGNNSAVQVYTVGGAPNYVPFNAQTYSVPIDESATGNVQIGPADTTLNGDQDYFLEFRVPINSTVFPTVSIPQTAPAPPILVPFTNPATYIYCGLTTQNNVVVGTTVINKEVPPPYAGNNPALCGGAAPLAPMVRITKTVTPLPLSVCQGATRNYNISITVTNTSGGELTGLSLTDVINADFVMSGSNSKDFPIGILAAGASTVLPSYMVTGSFADPGTYSLNTATVYQTVGAIVTPIGSVTGPNVNVDNCRGLLFS